MSTSTNLRDDRTAIWSPTSELLQNSALARFQQMVATDTGINLTTSEAFHAWSVKYPEEFWRAAVDFLEISCIGSSEPTFDSESTQYTPLTRRWFPKLCLNYAENLLEGPDGDAAIVSWSEEQLKRSVSKHELRLRTYAFAAYLQSIGVGPGDRVFAYLPNLPEAIIALLATAAVGATWSSCGTDYQIDGVLSRAKQLQPKVLVVATSYLWRGEDRRLEHIAATLIDQVASIAHIVTIDHPACGAGQIIPSVREPETQESFAVATSGSREFTVPSFAFDHPLFIMFSSGTTGRPKAIVHGAGNVLLEHKKELILHAGIGVGDRVFYQTSTSWMMWNWLVSVLACRASIVLYDGDALVGDGRALFRLAREERVTHFGTSAAFLGAVEKRGIRPIDDGPFAELRAILSTGSTLYPEQFDFILRDFKSCWIQSISGGTDILGCFALGCPTRPVWRGEIQCKSLGYDVQVFDVDGNKVIDEPGELVCVAPAPSMPLYFLNDDSGALYRAAYFGEFPCVWRHGDTVLERGDGGLIFLGRSDSTLKPGGVRVATADIYATLHGISEVNQALAVGYTPAGESSERVVLFVVLREPAQLDDALESRIREILKRANTFYVPHLILAAPDLPRTANNKLAETTIKKILRGEEVSNRGALANPECLEFFEDVRKSVAARFSG